MAGFIRAFYLNGNLKDLIITEFIRGLAWTLGAVFCLAIAGLGMAIVNKIKHLTEGKMKILSLILGFCLFTTNCFAAEFLIQAQNNWMIDADKTGWTAEQIAEADKQYKIGDIIQVFPDGKLSDYAHAGGKFYVIRVAGLSYETALKYHQEQTESYVDAQGFTHYRMVRRRIYRIRVEGLPPAVRNALKNTYVFNTNWVTVKNYINNKVTTLNE